MMTFAQKTITELVKKSGVSSLPSDFMRSIETVFESNGGSWERVAGGDAQHIGALKAAVRGVASGEVKAPPAASVKASSRAKEIEANITLQASLLRHNLKPMVLIASHLGLDLFDSAMDARTALDAALSRTSGAKREQLLNVAMALDGLIRKASEVGKDVLADTQSVRAWQVDGGADNPFDARVAAKNPDLKRLFATEEQTYQSPWSALAVVAKSVDDLTVEPLRFLRGKVEMRLVPFLREVAETLGSV